MTRRFRLPLLALAAALSPAAGAAEPWVERLLPLQEDRRERPGHDRRRFAAPEGFEIESAAGGELTGSAVNLTFDSLGRPVVSAEGQGVATLIDGDGDGKFDSKIPYAEGIRVAHGLYFAGPGELLMTAAGPQGDGFYRATDADGDGKAEKLELIAGTRIGGMGEHGPHAIRRGFDGAVYVEYGNHSHPDVQADPASPSRGLREDQLLPRYVDPRGHATHIRAPGGVIMRYDPETNAWTQFCAGFRNAFDFDVDSRGEIFTFDSDMEWDVGLPWFRPVRLVHAVPGADYGWRTGSGKFPSYYLETLPPAEELGRGSPVGVVFYEHKTYPEKYRGAMFLGDWSRGRILVRFQQREGATVRGGSVDFILGEPLNVTDLDVGPDGFLYFTTGGRQTTGGLYRVKHSGGAAAVMADQGVDAALDQPMHRSAWGRREIEAVKASSGGKWEEQLHRGAADEKTPPARRVRALELLQVHGPKPGAPFLKGLLASPEPEVRAAAALLLGVHPFSEAAPALAAALGDSDPLVLRRVCESLVRCGLDPSRPFEGALEAAQALFNLLDHPDRFTRTAARLALQRIDRRLWAGLVSSDSADERPRGAFEGLLAVIQTQTLVREADLVFEKLLDYSARPMNAETRLAFLRTLQLAFLRDVIPAEPGRRGFKEEMGRRLLPLYPSEDLRVTRELEFTLAYMGAPGAIPPMLERLAPGLPQEEQIHAAYALRAVPEGWTDAQRAAFLDWFDRARTMAGGASFEGFIENIFKSFAANLPERERMKAEERRESFLAARAKRAAELMAGDAAARKSKTGTSELAQMGFQELSEYLELDPMSYERGNAAKGKLVFQRAKCADCHIFGAEGKGGGPDLSNVVKRFRRREILEAIMFPSKVISDQYQALNVALKNGDVQNGFLAGDDGKTLTLINSAGARIDIPAADIAEKSPSTVSIMPEGLLETMSLSELVDLFAFLEQGSGV